MRLILVRDELGPVSADDLREGEEGASRAHDETVGM